MLKNETKCSETNMHTKFQLKLFKRRMILQDSNNEVFSFFRCPHFIPKTFALKNNSMKFIDNYIGFYLFIVFIVLWKHHLN